MIVTLTDRRMLEIWRQGANLEPALTEGSIERFDGIDIDSKLMIAMRAWYVDYLATAPLDMVPVKDLTDSATVESGPAPDQTTIRLTCKLARITALRIDKIGFVPLIDPDNPDNAELVRRLSNRFVRHGSCPVAFCRRGDDKIVVNLATIDENALTVYGVPVSEDDTFVVDERILADIPELAAKVIGA